MKITVTQRIARTVGSPLIVCGNSGYVLTFDFDAEWAEYAEKTAHFRCLRGGEEHRISVPFAGTVCEIPVLRGTDFVEIGVSAGNIRTTTAARIDCAHCVTDIPAKPYTAKTDIFNQLADMLSGQQDALPPLPSGFVFVVTPDGAYVTAADGSYIIAKE